MQHLSSALASAEKLSAVLLLAAAGAAALAGCGSSSSANTSEAAAAGSAKPSVEFTAKGGNDHPASFGVVASEEEREAASKVLEASLKAREGGDWAAQCATLTAAKIEQIHADAPNVGGGKTCASALEAEAQPLSASKAVRADTLTGSIAVLRVKGKKAYALYHGTGHKDYAMEMEKEGGAWKVAQLATTNVP